MPGVAAPVEREDLRLQTLQLIAECFQAFARNHGQTPIVRIGNHVKQLLDAIAAYRCYDAKLGKVGANGVDERSLLADEEMACTVEHQTGLLVGCLRRHNPHAWPQHCLPNGLGIGSIVLLAFQVGLHVGWQHQSNSVTESLQFAQPVMR
jgi:hypothetical protein